MKLQIQRMREILELPDDHPGHAFASTVLSAATDLCEGAIVFEITNTATILERESPDSVRISLDMFEPIGKWLIVVRYNPLTKKIVEVL